MQRLFITCVIVGIVAVYSTVTIAQDIEEAKKLNVCGLQYLECGNFEKAAEYFMKAIYCDPTKKFFYNNCAVAYMNMKKYTEAKNMLQMALAIDPGYVKALSNMAIVSFHLLQFAQAYEYYVKALAVDSNYTRERFQINKVIAGVKKVQDENPSNNQIKVILHQLELLKNSNRDIHSLQ